MIFTQTELDYLASQPLGRLATVDSNGAPQNNPVGFRYNPQTGTIDIGGRRMGLTRKYRNIARNPRVAFVVDDIVSMRPWRVRGIEIRGRAETVNEPFPDRPYFTPEIIRILPEHVFTWGIDPGADGMQKRRIPAREADELTATA
jgi:pyridoxamine 5'-phosphate oxidase family protein